MWEGLEIDAVKADWADVLSGFADKPKAIRYGLDHLPADRPPTATQFRDICRRAPDDTPMLPAPKADKKVAEQAIRRLGGVPVGTRANREWAKGLKRREESGEFLTRFQREAWREAMKATAE